LKQFMMKPLFREYPPFWGLCAPASLKRAQVVISWVLLRAFWGLCAPASLKLDHRSPISFIFPRLSGVFVPQPH